MNENRLQSPKKVVGILNITPDSFFARSCKQTEKEIAERAVQIMEEGADIIEVGGCSSRPDAIFVGEEEEMSRLRFGLEILSREAPGAVVSVDTFRSKIARECVEKFGVAIINDISAGNLDEKMFDTIAGLQVSYIIMHMRGTPQTMMEHTHYEKLIPDILLYFTEKIQCLQQKGVQNVWIDPGFGFSKTTEQNYSILNNLDQFTVFGLPVLAGFSRKTMIQEVINVPAEEALNATTALNLFALTKGVDILRVHDVKEAVQTVQIYSKIRQS